MAFEHRDGKHTFLDIQTFQGRLRGIPVAYEFNPHLNITLAKVGGLELTKEQLTQMIGERGVLELEQTIARNL